MMRRLLFFALGLMFGAAVGSALVLLLTPTSGNGLKKRVKSRYNHALAEGRAAADTHRKVMEAQLANITSKPALKSALPAPVQPRTPVKAKPRSRGWRR